MSDNPLLPVRMGLKAGLALLTLLLILSFGVTEAVRQRAEDVQWVSRVSSLSTDMGQRFLRADSGSKAPPRSQGHPRRLIGSSAPDCGHTCGACAPCDIQVVSYECSEAMEPHAEACPLGYLCVCRGRSFPIP